MKSLLTLSILLVSLSATAAAQSDGQKTFSELKTLAGNWEGAVTTQPAQGDMQGKEIKVSLRVTSTGNALMHEMKMDGAPDDPITMFYVDSGRLMLTHYCDAGNRPRMVAKVSPDGKTVEFDFLDVGGSTEPGHMHHVLFTMIDANHHTEDWTFMMPKDNAVRAHFDLHRDQDRDLDRAK